MNPESLKQKSGLRVGWLLPLSALFLILPVRPSSGSFLGPSPPPGPLGTGHARLVRTFAPRPHAHAITGSGFQLTRDDFLRLFAIGREVHVNLSPEGSIYEMDIGFTDPENAQA